MGIRVVCPNGHKLNVKSFLAGKRGVCPHCSAKFDIPASAADGSGDEKMGDEKMQSVGTVSQSGATAATGASASSAELRASHAAKGNSAVRHVAPAAGAAVAPTAPVMPVNPAVQPVPVAVPLQPMAPVGGVQPFGAQPVAVPVTMPAAVAMPSVVVARPTVVDPLAEAPEACWYVRPPTGGQYGPAKANTMRQWVAEGRVTADSLVWREGWPDWKLASATFPALGGPGVIPPASDGAQPAVASAMPAADDPFTGIGPANPSISGPRKSLGTRHGDGTGRVVAIAALCMALVVLGALLVYVLKLR